MFKTVIFFTLFFLTCILVQEESYGFVESFEPSQIPNFNFDKTSDIISLDITNVNDQPKRYLVFGNDSLNNAYQDTKNIVYGINSNSGFFSVGVFDESEALNLKSQGYYVIEDYMLDFHSRYLSTNTATDISQIGNIAESEKAHTLYNVTGNGVTIAVVDTGVDFSNPDIIDSLLRNHLNEPVMLDADGQGLVLTNSTFYANKSEFGLIKNYTKSHTLPVNATSTVYLTNEGVFLDMIRNGNNTKISVYNSFYPYAGFGHILEGTVDNDFKIGKTQNNYIESKSGIYHLGYILNAHLGKLQVVPVLVTDPNEAGVYDTITPDLSTSWTDFFREDRVTTEEDYDFDFTDETSISIGDGNELLVYDSDGDGQNDYSAGIIGASVVDVYGLFSKKAEIDDYIGAVNGTLLPPMDKDGRFFGLMTDFFGHGTASSSTIASKGITEYDIYNDTKKYTIKGIAPDVKILPVKALWAGDVVYAWLWIAGFENEDNRWVYTGEPKADIISNSWGISTFPNFGYVPGFDFLAHIVNILATPESIHENYPGMTIVSSAGNSGHGYGTIASPGISSYGISVGAVTSNDFVGYSSFKEQPRFGNTTTHADHVVDFSSRGPGVLGEPKPDLMSIGAFSFVPSAVTITPDTDEESFSLFGGTSMAAPITAGAAALVIESLNERQIDYDPFAIRNILMSTTDDLQNDPFTQGTGLVNALSAVKVVNGEGGKFLVHNNESFSNIKKVLDRPTSLFDLEIFGLGKAKVSENTFPITSWYGGILLPGEKTTTTFTLENPTNKSLDIKINPVTLKLIEKLQMDGVTKVHLQDPILNDTGIYRPNYIKLSDIGKDEPSDQTSIYKQPNQNSIINSDSSLMVLNLNFPFTTFMNQTDSIYADDLKISSLYIYDWKDKNKDNEISSDELSLVNRGGSWGTVQEVRVSNPAEKFEDEPVIGVYPVPERISYWIGNTNQNSTAMNYTLTASYYKNTLWEDVIVDNQKITIPPNNSTKISATISPSADKYPGIYQGFLNFEGEHHDVHSPVSYNILQVVDQKEKQIVIDGSEGETLYGNGYVKGAFDMSGKYMAGDWRQYSFDIQDSTINSASINLEWEKDHTNFSAFMIDPQGRIIQTNVPSGVFGHFWGWPTIDWLGVTPFSQGGGFFPVKNKDNTSTVMFAPINQTGTYTLLLHSTLFNGESITEPFSLAARFGTILADDDPPEIIFDMPEFINNNFKIRPVIIEENLNFVKFYVDGNEIENQTPVCNECNINWKLDDGPHEFRIHASDILENDVDKTFSFIVDNIPPKITLDLPKHNTTVSNSLKIDFKVNDKNLSETGAIQILLPQGDSYEDITSFSYNTTNVFAGAYNLQIVAKDLAGNEAVETVPFTVDHSFIQKPIKDIKPEIQEPNILIIVISIVIITIIIAFVAIKKARTKHDQDKTLKQDL